VAESDRVVLNVSACRKGAVCPICKCHSSVVHSYYVRKLSDLPWNGIAVCIRLSSRRFFCRNHLCRQRIFTERFSGTAARYARRTLRLNETVTLLGFTAGGRGGARLAHELGMKTSEDTILRCVRNGAISQLEPPRVLGVDDWAMRKGHSYGTILCDLERHRVVDLLPDRSRDTLVEWLGKHPGIKVISRDRASAYSEAASLAAPTATQVADRWHLLRNIGEALQRVLEKYPTLLRKAAQNVVLRPETTPVEQQELPAPVEPDDPRSKDRRAARLARYEEVRELARRGMYQRAIARKTGMGRRTIRRWLGADSFPERKLPRRTSRADGFADYLKQRYAEGCHNSAQLWRELCEKGYRGAKSQVRDCVHRYLREKSSTPVQPPLASMRAVSPRQTAWLLFQPRSLPEQPHLHLEQLLSSSPEIASAASIARELVRIIYQKDTTARPTLFEAARSTPLAQFAAHLARDEAAILAALQQPWSNGQVEGQVNRLKAIKRQMFGRARFDLLRQRVLYAA